MFDPEKFGQAMGDLVRDAVSPLKARIAELEKQLSERIDYAEEISSQVKAAIAAIPAPKDGRDGKDGEPGRDGQDGKDGEPGRDGKDGEPGKDGRDGKDGEPGRDGQDGKDGEPGRDGKSFTIEDADLLITQKMAQWELDFERRAVATLEKAVDRMPVPKDGKDGQDGRDGKDGQDGKDGLGFDDLSLDYDGERTVNLAFQKGDQRKSIELRLPVVLDRGVYKEGEGYEPGDGVSWAGAFWIAQSATSEKPDSAKSGWRLAVKKGRDGRDGRDGIDKTVPVKVTQ